MSARKNRKGLGSLGREAKRRRTIALARLRAVAVAECHRDRARAGMAKVEGIIADGIRSGFNMSAEAYQLAELRQALGIAESGLDAARRTAGLDHAA